MKNVQNLICFLFKSTFFKVTKKIFGKKEEMGKKYFLGKLNIYLWIQKSHSQISIKLDFKLNLGMGFFSETRRYEGTSSARNKIFGLYSAPSIFVVLGCFYGTQQQQLTRATCIKIPGIDGFLAD